MTAGGVAAFALILGASGIVGGLSGFGFSAIGALSLWLVPPKLGVPLLMSLSAANQMMSLGQLRADLKPWHEWWPEGPAPYLLGGVLGVPLGLAILHALPTATLMMTLGGLLVVYAAYSLLKPERLQVAYGSSWRVSSLVGMVGGVIGGFTAFPGAAVVVWSGLRHLPKAESRAIVQPYIFTLQLVALALLAVERPETFGYKFWALLAIALPVVLPCTLLGVCLYRLLSDVSFRRVTFILLGISGMGLLIKAAGAASIVQAIAAAHPGSGVAN